MSTTPIQSTLRNDEDEQETTTSEVPIIEVEYLLHTDDRPFCYDGPCPCHENQEAIAQVNGFYQQGLVSANDATRIVQGKTV